MVQTNSWQDKRILITGVCGTIGKELLNQLKDAGASEIIGLDNNEMELFFLGQKTSGYSNIHFYMCDIRSVERLKNLFQGIDIILHTAALKHVILNELSPSETIATNIIGTQNVIEAARQAQVQRVIFTSSDKAVNPTNVMGTSKLMGERLMTAANASKRQDFPIYASTRFGNVLGSSGSVIPIFKNQIADGGPVTLTDPHMSRFIMTIEEAARLVMDSVFLAKGGEVFVTKMPVVMIKDLADAMIELLSDGRKIDVEVIGTKPGEKLYEELINEEEVRRTHELERYFVTLPAFKSVYSEIDYVYEGSLGPVEQIYRSDIEKEMSVQEIKTYLTKHNLL